MAIDPQCMTFFTEQRAFMKRTDEALGGDGSDGKPGLVLRVDRNTQQGARTAKWMWIIAVAVVTGLAKLVF